MKKLKRVSRIAETTSAVIENPEVGNYSDLSRVGVEAYDPKSGKWI